MIEYKLVDCGWFNNIDDGLVENGLNELGKEGWKLMQILPNTRAIFYRENNQETKRKEK